ncbi:MAG: class I SAM-dependent methyltransferase [Chloroflexi bacterium]|nr:class I SAM-dependent methyltransferase [Chloroflexota bacterium]
MRFIPCNLCGADECRELYPSTLSPNGRGKGGSAFLCTSPDYGQHYRVVQCLRCGYVYANPRGDPAEVMQAYESVEDPLYLRERAGRERTFRKHLKPLHRVAGEPNGRKLLDVGAYIGVFVEVARAAGWDAEGIEPSGWAVGEAVRAGLPVRRGTLSSVGFPSESFDVITLWDVIEHFDDPRAELDHVFRLLKPGGVVVIHTIDMGSLTAKLMGARWPFLMEMHIAFFSRATLRAMLERVGFQYVGDHTEGRYLRLGYLAGRVSAAFGSWVGRPLERAIAALKMGEWMAPVNTLDLFTAYGRKAARGDQ